MDPEVVRVLEGIPRLGEERWDCVASYQGHVESVMDRLLFDDLELDLAAVRWPRAGRILWDGLLRGALGGDTQGMEASSAGGLMSTARRGLSGEDVDWGSSWNELADAVDADVLALGLPLAAEIGASAPEQVVEGLESAGPATLAWLQEHDDTGGVIQCFLHDSIWERAPLLRRMEAAMDASGAAIGAGVARIEHLLSSSVGDDAVERLSASAADDGHLAASRGFTALEGDWEAFVHHAAVFGGGDLQGTAALEGLLVGRWCGEGALVPVPLAVMRAWRGLRHEPATLSSFLEALRCALKSDPAPAGWPSDAEEWLSELLESGAVGCFPALT